MFCFQCEQTLRVGDEVGCSVKGQCGKDAVTSDLQDELVHAALRIARADRAARALGSVDPEPARFVTTALFTTLTNVNFDPERFEQLLAEAEQVRRDAEASLHRAAAAAGVAPVLPEVALGVGVRDGRELVGDDVVGLRAFVLYAVKGLAAYAHHARVLGGQDAAVEAGVIEVLDFLASAPTDAEELLAAALRVGELNLTVMELLQNANTDRFGDPVPTVVRTEPVPGRAILVSGHDFADLQQILELTAGTGINVYTHGEMLPANAYPGLARYPHLAGNYGGAWQQQQRDFSRFPGAILMTSNCLIKPTPAYAHRIFTTGPTGWPGVRHLEPADFAEVVRAALAEPGFGPEVAEREPRTTLIGFGTATLLGVADAVVDAVQAGRISAFHVIGGCDGASPARSVYARAAEQVADDAVILTMGCGKFRFNHREFGSIGEIPRLLDLGQCNDSFGALVIAKALADRLGVTVHDLPLHLVVSWFEQKAVAVLCSLLALGLRNISLGPTLPAFVTPAVLDLLVERFGISGPPAVELREPVTSRS